MGEDVGRPGSKSFILAELPVSPLDTGDNTAECQGCCDMKDKLGSYIQDHDQMTQQLHR